MIEATAKQLQGTAAEGLSRADLIALAGAHAVRITGGPPIKARVLGKAFRGAEFLYTLGLPSGQSLLSLVASHHNHRVGEDIGIRLEIDHLIAFAH